MRASQKHPTTPPRLTNQDIAPRSTWPLLPLVGRYSVCSAYSTATWHETAPIRESVIGVLSLVMRVGNAPIQCWCCRALWPRTGGRVRQPPPRKTLSPVAVATPPISSVSSVFNSATSPGIAPTLEPAIGEGHASITTKVARRCGQPGHESRMCPSSGYQVRGSSCEACQPSFTTTAQVMSSPTATAVADPSANSQVQCLQCLGFGHMARSCPNPRVCHRCGQPGHESRRCHLGPGPFFACQSRVADGRGDRKDGLSRMSFLGIIAAPDELLLSHMPSLGLPARSGTRPGCPSRAVYPEEGWKTRRCWQQQRHSQSVETTADEQQSPVMGPHGSMHPFMTRYLRIVDRDELTDGQHETWQWDITAIGSYSCHRSSTPSNTRIVVPGMPPVYVPPADPEGILLTKGRGPSQDAITHYDLAHPLETLHHVVAHCTPTFDWSTVSLVINRGHLSDLLRFISGDKSRRFEFTMNYGDEGPPVVERSWKYHGKDPTYGWSFEEAMTRPRPGTEDQLSRHHRVSLLRLGDLNLVVRAEVDACVGDPEGWDEDTGRVSEGDWESLRRGCFQPLVAGGVTELSIEELCLSAKDADFRDRMMTQLGRLVELLLEIVKDSRQAVVVWNGLSRKLIGAAAVDSAASEASLSAAVAIICIDFLFVVEDSSWEFGVQTTAVG
ncbi:hypothetical protein FOZ60_007977 [Perkinsus olseni]|uniref:CCHC-type domain-containing protein n=1 Tax=Perkinsus olseni TaxID=32597 RepID=A0A7J6NKX8_PEROL|nr:hypothetical protein FOZ60_007977 [Perkinsus olseni]